MNCFSFHYQEKVETINFYVIQSKYNFIRKVCVEGTASPG